MADREFLNNLLKKTEESFEALVKLSKNKDIKENQDYTKAWRKLRQVRHALREELGYDVERAGHSKETFTDRNICDKEESHESFGTLVVSNITGNIRLVGTTTEILPNCVRLTIHRSKRMVDSSTHTEYYMPHGLPLIQVEMSRNQWAEAICGMNGMGVPVTVRTVMGTDMDELPKEVVSPFQQIIDDAKAKFKNTPEDTSHFKEAVHKLATAVENMGLPKGKTATIANSIRALYGQHAGGVASNASWAAERLQEEAVKAVSQAKIEVAGSISAMINQAGLKALGIKEVAVPKLRGVVESEDGDD